MADKLLQWANDPRTARIINMLGLPAPVRLAREKGGYAEQPLAGKTFLVAGSPGGHAIEAVRTSLQAAGATVTDRLPEPAAAPAPSAGAASGKPSSTAAAEPPRPRIDGIVLDGTGVRTPDDYRVLYDVFHPIVRSLARNGRVVVVGGLPEALEDPVAAAAARGLEGFTRSLAKEIGKRGANANLLYVEQGAEARLDEALRFFCGARCTFVDGQAARVTARVRAPAGVPRSQVLKGKIALVTGAARGIGAATAERLAEEGAHVVCLDIPADRDGLYDTATRVGGTPFAADISDPATPARLGEFLLQKFGGVDVVVHNAGITRDKTLANMKEHLWDMVIAINFRAITAVDSLLIERGVLRDDGRIICLSSMGGVAGNFGQTNYAATKAALIGYVAAQAPRLAPRGITVNAVAPGFIETRMTAAMPLVPREVGRRMSSLSQGGQPRDVAELITFFATPGAFGLSGNTVRVCGQSLLGA